MTGLTCDRRSMSTAHVPPVIYFLPFAASSDGAQPRTRMPDHLPDHPVADPWPTSPCPYGMGEWWMAETANIVLAVVPPGVVGDLHEADDAHTRWRTLSWPAGVDYDDLSGEDETPARAQPVSVAEVLTLIGPDHHERVRAACRAQLAHLHRFSTGLDGRPDDERARQASQVLSRLHHELDHAFPLEAWHLRPDLPVDVVPDTAAEFLREFDGTVPSRADLWFARIQKTYWRAVRTYRKANGVREAGQHAVLSRVRSSSPPRTVDHGHSDCGTGEHAIVGH